MATAAPDSLVDAAKRKSQHLIVQWQYLVARAPDDDRMRATFEPYRQVLEKTAWCFDLLQRRRRDEYNVAATELRGLLVDCMAIYFEVADEGSFIRFAKRCQADMLFLSLTKTRVFGELE